MARSEPLNILVLAVGGNVSQGILKCLARSSLRCRVVGADVSPLQFGLYTTHASYVGPWAHAPEFLDWLLELCRREEIDAILSGAEPVLRVLAREKALIEEETGACCLVCDAETLALGDDKWRTAEWLREQGMLFPRSARAEDGPAAAELLDACGFPLVAKPRMGGGAQGLLMVECQEDLDYVARKQGYMVQECLGDNESEYTAGCFCGRDGKLRGSITMWRALYAGATYRAVVGAYPEVTAEAERIVQALRPMGPANVQLRMTPRGPVCFEINPRFSGSGPMRARFGFNEVEAALRHYVLGEAAVDLPKATEGVALRYWNELYVDREAHGQLRAEGRLEDPWSHPPEIEPYGSRP